MGASDVEMKRLIRICRCEVGELIDLGHSLHSQIHTDHFQRLLVADFPSSNPNPPFEAQEAEAMALREVLAVLEVMSLRRWQRQHLKVRSKLDPVR